MSSSITSIQSPSHPISLHLGGHSTDTQDGPFNPQHALATLGQTTTELGKDFVLLIKCASLSSPAALLEVHPTIPNSKALMVTLVPKFNLPKAAKPEVVFIVDRSGSMHHRVAPLKSSLSVFLKSLPLDVNFNICSFGSHHSFLWDLSRPYSNQSFAEAQNYCDHIEADFGGTEILPAIKSTVARRFKDLSLEIMVLTDGQVWNSDALFDYVEKETKKGDVRLFSLGIGRNVSHALIDGMARVGRGFSQVILDEREAMESKVARMLRGALSAHVVNYRLEWEGKPSTEVVNTPSSPIRRATRPISLFDAHVNTDSPVSFSDSPGFTIPSVIQAPYKIQPLFPFSRSTAYAVLSDDARPPSRVWLRGTTPEGDELELEIVVQRLSAPGKTIHQLAARKILQELKDGTSYVHSAIDKERQPALLTEWVKKEGVRVGLKYGIAGHWTSFVAVERREEERETESRDQGFVDVPPPSGLDDNEEWDTVDTELGDGNETPGGSRGGPSAANFGRRVGGGAGLSVPVMMMRAPPPPSIPYPTKKLGSSLSSKLFGSSQKSKSAGRMSDVSGSPTSEWGLPPAYSDVSMDKSSGSTFQQPVIAPIPPPTPNAQPLIGSNPTGGLESRSDKKLGLFLSGLSNPVGASPRPYAPVSQKYSLRERSLSRRAASPTASSASPTSVPFSGPLLGAVAGDAVGREANFESDSVFSRSYKSSAPASMKFFSSSSSKGKMSSLSDLGISYSPSSAPPPERLSADTGAQPLSLRTKTLIDLQTFEGSFVLNSALATLLGVSSLDLELDASLMRFIPSSWDLELSKKVWATVLAIKLFETQLAGERSVWQLVVDKARAWIGGLAGVRAEDISQLEKMAGEQYPDVFGRRDRA